MLGLSSSDVIAGASVVIASCALIATIWQGATARKHNRLSVRPHLDWIADRTIGKRVRLSLTNAGLGPCIIDDFVIAFEGTVYRAGSLEGGPDLSTLIADSINGYIECWMPGLGTPIQAGASVDLFRFPASDASLQVHARCVEALNKIGLLINYRSIYGERMTLRRDPEH
jgi:hypothetical protein